MEVVKGNTSDKIGNPDIKLQVQNLFLGLTKILSVEWPSSAFLPLIYYKSFRYVSINFLISSVVSSCPAGSSGEAEEEAEHKEKI